jgi:small-conductance mechanosensitive channel
MPEQLQTYILSFAPMAGKIALIFIAYYIAKKLWSRLVIEYTKRWSSNENAIASIAIKAGDMTLLIFAIITALGTMGINMSALIAGLGLGGFALGYALKDSVSNLLSGILIMVYKPFKNGDIIEVAKFKGKVIEIDLRYTKLEDDETIFLVPNKKMFSDPVAISKS